MLHGLTQHFPWEILAFGPMEEVIMSDKQVAESVLMVTCNPLGSHIPV